MKNKTEVDSYFKGFRYIVKFMEDGHRNGYVQINDSDVFEKIKNQYNDCLNVDIDCHGGITFVKEMKDSEYLPDGNWIGFDCNHLYDGHDFELSIEIFGNSDYIERMKRLFDYEEGEIKSKDFCEDECKKIIEQIL